MNYANYNREQMIAIDWQAALAPMIMTKMRSETKHDVVISGHELIGHKSTCCVCGQHELTCRVR